MTIVRRMHAHGMSDAEIADACDVNVSVVFRARRRLGLPPRITRSESGRLAGAASWATRMDRVVSRDEKGRFARKGTSRG